MKRKTIAARFMSWLLALGMVVTSGVPVNAQQTDVTTGDDTEVVTEKTVVGPTASSDATKYNIYPIPQDIDYTEGSFTLSDEVVIVKEKQVDTYTVNFLKKVLDNYQVTYKEAEAVEAGKTNIVLGVKDDTGVADQFLTDNSIAIEKSDLFQQNDAYLLDASDKGIVILGKDTDATYYGVATLQMMFSSFAGEKFLNTNIEDFATVATRGYIEGFYGQWNFEERANLMRFAGNYKMNSYVYAAKGDAYHTNRWADLYPNDMLQNFKTLVDVGKETKVEFAWSVHLGTFFGTFTLSDVQNKTATYTTQYNKLMAKFEQLMTAGIKKFDILNDDFGSGSNEMVVLVLNELNKDLKAKGCPPIVYCPQGYNRAWSGQGAELEAMKALDEDITIYWTGDDVNAPITQETVNFLIEKTNHKPDFWLNYPVNEHAGSGIFLGDITHYARNNVTGMAGFHSNPSKFAYSNQVGLYQLAALVWNNNNYSDYAEEVWLSAFDYLQPEVVEAYRTIGRNIANCPGSSRVGQGFPESEYLRQELEVVASLVEAGKPIKSNVSARMIYDEFKNILEAIEIFRKDCANPTLVSELDPWLNCLRDIVTAGRDALDSLYALEDGDASTGWEKLSSASAAYDTRHTYRAYTYREPNNATIAKAGSKRLEPFVGKMITAARNNLTPVLNPNDETFTPTLYARLGGQVQTANDNGKKMYDGDETTFASWSVVQQEGDYFGLDLGRVIPVRDIQILQAKADDHHDFFHYAKLQYSEDGVLWKDVENTTVELDGRGISVEGLEIRARFVRYALTRVGTEGKPDYWTHVREFTVNKKVEKQPMVYTNVESLAATPLTMENANLGIRGLTGVALEKDQYVGVVLPEPVMATDFEKEISNGNNLTVEYSINGQQWTEAGDITEAVAVKYLRIRNKTENTITTDITKLELMVQNLKADGSLFLSTMADGFSEGGAEQIFDGDLTTYALTANPQAKDSYLIFDLGSVLDIHDVEVVTEDGNRTLYQAKIQVLKDNTTWEDIAVVNNDTIFEVPYRYVRCNGEGIQARYLRIYITADNVNALKLHEIKINEKVEENPLLSPVSSTVAGNTDAMIDGDITTLFSAEVGSDDYVEYRIFENTNVDQISVLLGQASAHGKVYAVTPAGEVELGALSKTVNTFDTTGHEVITSVKIKWTGTETAAIHDIFVTKGADHSGNIGTAVEPVVYNKAELLVAVTEAQTKAESNNYTTASKAALTQALEEANGVMEDVQATPEAIQQAVTKISQAIAALEEKISVRKNIALGKNATVSGTSAGAAANITDGTLEAKWDSDHLKGGSAVEESWFVIDLGEEASVIESMKVSYFNLVYPTIYKVQVSNDNISWTTVKELTRQHGGAGHPVDEIAFEKPITARYVKMLFEEINSSAAGNGVGVKEAEIMGRTIYEEATLVQVAEKEDVLLETGESFDFTQLSNLHEIQVEVADMQEKINVLAITNWNTDGVNISQSGTHEVFGTLALGSILNPQSLKTKVNVIVQGENDIPVETITLNEEEVTLTLGETVTLEATVTPDNATYATVTWNSSASEVVSVKDGVLTAHQAGEAIITASAGGKSVTCTVVVEKEPEVTPVESIVLSQTEVTLTLGETETVTLEATINPENASYTEITWISDKQEVAEVVNGVVTAKAVGTAVITASVDGKTASCTITIVEKQSTGEDTPGQNPGGNNSQTPGQNPGGNTPQTPGQNQGENAAVEQEKKKVEETKQNINGIISSTNTYQAGAFTAKSWEAYQNALTSVKQLINKPNVTSQELLAAQTTLEQAIKGLEELPVADPLPAGSMLGKVFTIKDYKYKVTKVGKTGGEVEVLKVTSKAATIKIPASIKMGKTTYKVTSIGKNALKNNKTAKKVVIGNNVKTIGNSAFQKCAKLTSITLGKGVEKLGSNVFKNSKKLKTIVLKTTKLKASGLAKKTFAGIGKTTKVKVPKKSVKTYQKLFKTKGLNKNVKVTK